MARSKSKPFLFFFLAILSVSVFMFVIEWRQRQTPSLVVAANKGIASLFSADGRLAAVFQDGRTCVWDWDEPEITQAEFIAGSGRAIPLGAGHLAALSRTGDRRLLSVYDIDTAKKIKDLAVGWEDQDIQVRTSPGLSVPVLVRRNEERDGAVGYEFLTVNLAAELLRPPVLKSLDAATQTLRDFAVSDAGVLIAAGADAGQARLLAVDLNTGQTLWDQTWPDSEELTTAAISPDGQTVWAGDRAGSLLTVAVEDGRLRSKVSLLMPGETRSVTNDFSVLNLAVSPDGRRLGCTIAPVAYTADAATGLVTHRFSRHKVVSKVVFSPDSRRMATSDLRADGVILIHALDK